MTCVVHTHMADLRVIALRAGLVLSIFASVVAFAVRAGAR
jgi:hypothetical protein